MSYEREDLQRMYPLGTYRGCHGRHDMVLQPFLRMEIEIQDIVLQWKI